MPLSLLLLHLSRFRCLCLSFFCPHFLSFSLCVCVCVVCGIYVCLCVCIYVSVCLVSSNTLILTLSLASDVIYYSQYRGTTE